MTEAPRPTSGLVPQPWRARLGTSPVDTEANSSTNRPSGSGSVSITPGYILPRRTAPGLCPAGPHHHTRPEGHGNKDGLVEGRECHLGLQRGAEQSERHEHSALPGAARGLRREPLFSRQAVLDLGLDKEIRNLITEAIFGFGCGFELISKCECAPARRLLMCLLK